MFSLRSWVEAGGWRQKGGREFQGESWSVWSVILYSEKRFSILLLNSDQSHRGFHQASVTPWIPQIASQSSLMADGRRHFPAPKHRPSTHSNLTERKFGKIITQRSAKGHMWFRFLRWPLKLKLNNVQYTLLTLSMGNDAKRAFTLAEAFAYNLCVVSLSKNMRAWSLLWRFSHLFIKSTSIFSWVQPYPSHLVCFTVWTGS